jgi:serine/threonine-protein kinase
MDRSARTAPAAENAGGEFCSRAESRASIPSVAAGSPTPALLSPGTCVAGKYIICDVLGTGGTAIVYAAEQVGLKRVVAFKLYPFGGALAQQLLERFEHEAQLLARVHHENVVAVFDTGSMPDGSPYLVVQRLRGESLATRLLAGPLTVTEAVDLTHQALNALGALSDAGIAHRDVKPDNLVLDRLADGGAVLKLVDFGIAKETCAEASCVLDELIGTPNYMAPEQIRGERVDARCDLYALGATLYEMLCGRPPHRGETLHEIVRATLYSPITPVRALRPDCPEGLEQIVMTALARDPTDRFPSARAMKRALLDWQAAQQLGGQLSAGKSHDTRAEDTLRILTTNVNSLRPGKRVRKRGLALVTCVAALASLMLSREPERAARDRERTELSAAFAQQPSASSELDPTPQANVLTSALGVQTDRSEDELLSRARTAASAWLERARRFALRRSLEPDAHPHGP